MILISHRGNISGPKPELENHPDYIREALELGYDCEIDVWYKDNEWYLGHDEPLYDVSQSFLRNDKLWCHAKHLKALNQMLNNNIHCFWHQKDNFTLTSKGYIWTYPGMPVCDNSVIVDLNNTTDIEGCYGVCSDTF